MIFVEIEESPSSSRGE
jgi:hypothetical protein